MQYQVKIGCFGCGQKLDVTELEAFSTIACPECNTDLIIPLPFGSYALEEILCDTGMTTVYRAMDLTLDREICVKILKPELAGDEALAKAFIEEASRASALNHPNIVPIYSCGETTEQPYIVRQYMEQGGINSRFGTIYQPQEKLCRWFIEAAKGLEFASQQELLHGNIRPDNILLDADERVKVADFGLDHLVYAGAPVIDRQDVTAADVMYMSPEMISTGRQDIRGDLYSLGAVMYYMVTQRPPFDSDDAETAMNVRFAGPPRPASELRHDTVEELDQLIIDMLAAYPKDRLNDYAEVIERLLRALEKPLPEPGPVPNVVVAPAIKLPEPDPHTTQPSTPTSEPGPDVAGSGDAEPAPATVVDDSSPTPAPAPAPAPKTLLKNGTRSKKKMTMAPRKPSPDAETVVPSASAETANDDKSKSAAKPSSIRASMPKLKRKKASATRPAGAKGSVPGLAAQGKSKDAVAEAAAGPKEEGPRQFGGRWYWWLIPAAVMIVCLTLLAIVLADPPAAWYQENLGPLLKGG
ncbi:MAG: protein kinase [Lentisphaeria bacterium]|jgi:serine/threonine-protein kinase|nr:protein kinase [Lentisphaeria bacterium]